MRIISDTTCHLSVDEAKQENIILVANQIMFQDKTYRDYLEIDSASFMKLLEHGFATTSQPAIGEVMEAYESTRPIETLHITTGKGLSSAYDSATGVKNSIQADHVSVFSSCSVAGPNRYLTLLASKLSQLNMTKAEIIERLQRCVNDTQSYVIPVNFKFLQNSGRLTAPAAILGGLLKLKPVMAQSDDKLKIDKFAITRTWPSAIKSVVDDLVKRGVDIRHKIYVLHAYNKESAAMAIQAIKDRITHADIESFVLAPAMITHGGPECVVIQYILKDELYNQ